MVVLLKRKKGETAIQYSKLLDIIVKNKQKLVQPMC